MCAGFIDDINTYLDDNFALDFAQVRSGGHFDRRELRDKDSPLLESWRGIPVGLADQIPLAARESSFHLMLLYAIRLAKIQRECDPRATAMRRPAFMAMVGAAGAGKSWAFLCISSVSKHVHLLLAERQIGLKLKSGM